MKLNNIEVLITDACNMKCKYCYETQQSTFMTIQTARDVVEWGLQRKKKEWIVFDLFGGEPLLNFDVVKELYASYKGRKDLSFHLFTNGTIWKDELIEMIQDKNYFSVQISIDGGSITQNAQRPLQDGRDSFATVLDTCKKLQKHVPYALQLKPVICPNSLERLVEDVKCLVDNGFTIIGQSLLRENIKDEQWTLERLQVLEIQMRKLANYYADELQKGNRLLLSGLLDPVAGFLRKTDIACWAGKSGLAVGYNGDIFPCGRFRRPTDKMGNIYQPFIYDTQPSYLTQRTVKNLACSECILNECCAGNCPEIQRSLMGSCCLPFPPVCEVFKVMTKISLELFTKMNSNLLYKELLTLTMGGKWSG